MKQTLHFDTVVMSSVVCAILACAFFTYVGLFDREATSCTYAAWMLATYGLLCYIVAEVLWWRKENLKHSKFEIWFIRCINLLLGAVIFRILGWDIPMFIAVCTALMILRFFIIAIGIMMHRRQ